MGWLAPLALAAALAAATPVAAQGPAPTEPPGVVAYNTKDFFGAAELLLDVAGRDALSALLVGDLYLRGAGLPQDDYEAIYWLRRAAAGGKKHPALDKLLAKHQAFPQDDRAMFLFHRGRANARNAGAEDLYRFGMVLKTGRGIDRTRVEAMVAFQLAASHKHSFAEVELAEMHIEDKDLPAARVSHQLAARLGNPVGQYGFAEILMMERNTKEAARWYLAAAQQNYAKAQGMIGMLMVTGQGVPADTIEGTKWLILSLHRVPRDREDIYLQALNRTLGALSEAQRAEAQSRVRAYVAGLKDRR